MTPASNWHGVPTGGPPIYPSIGGALGARPDRGRKIAVKIGGLRSRRPFLYAATTALAVGLFVGCVVAALTCCPRHAGRGSRRFHDPWPARTNRGTDRRIGGGAALRPRELSDGDRTGEHATRGAGCIGQRSRAAESTSPQYRVPNALLERVAKAPSTSLSRPLSPATAEGKIERFRKRSRKSALR